jgi:hypothetical protein
MMKLKGSSGMGVLKAIGIVLAVAIAAFIIWIFTLPEGGGGVKMANEMDAYALEYLEKHKLLNDSEQLLSYYDATLSMNGSEAAILTTERVMYHKNKRTPAVYLKDIKDIQHRYEKFYGDIIEITTNSGIPFKIEIAPFNQGESFYNALMGAWKAVRQK